MIVRQTVCVVVFVTLMTLSGFLTHMCCIKTTDEHLIKTDKHPVNADNLITRNIHFEGDKFWSNTVGHIGDCAVLCLRMTKCMSFNFDLETLVCELNSDQLIDADHSGRSKPNSVYSSIRNWPRKVIYTHGKKLGNTSCVTRVYLVLIFSCILNMF